MILFAATIQKFGEKGEKTGWTYVDIPATIADKINKGIKKSYRVKGKINNCAFEKSSLYPMGEGNFIFAINATLQSKLKLPIGALVNIEMCFDSSSSELPAAFLELLEEEPESKIFFHTYPKLHKVITNTLCLGLKVPKLQLKK